MSMISTWIRPWRVLAIISALLIGTSLAPVAAQVPATGSSATTQQVRSASCHGLDFTPMDSETTYSYKGLMRIRTFLGNETSGTGYFGCDPGLPSRAVVTQVQFTLWDDDPSGSVRYCGLFRSGLSVAKAKSYDEVAQVPDTGEKAVPGAVRLSDTTIKHGTIDNGNFVYWLQCQITSDTPPFNEGIGIFGADILYTISAANG